MSKPPAGINVQSPPSKHSLDAGRLAYIPQTSYGDLPQGALDLLAKMKCHVGSNYDYGSAVDLNGDGEPEYQVCCGDRNDEPKLISHR
jgi:hypothetical protein